MEKDEAHAAPQARAAERAAHTEPAVQVRTLRRRNVRTALYLLLIVLAAFVAIVFHRHGAVR